MLCFIPSSFYQAENDKRSCFLETPIKTLCLSLSQSLSVSRLSLPTAKESQSPADQRSTLHHEALRQGRAAARRESSSWAV